jgi:hypothetical protein
MAAIARHKGLSTKAREKQECQSNIDHLLLNPDFRIFSSGLEELSDTHPQASPRFVCMLLQECFPFMAHIDKPSNTTFHATKQPMSILLK